MKIKTLGDIAKITKPNPKTTALHARAVLYEEMGNYIEAAHAFATGKGQNPHDEDHYKMTLGSLLVHLMVDARAHLDADKFKYLCAYSVEEGGEYTVSHEAMEEALRHQWGGEDVFMLRLSGNLPGSYAKALAGLKHQSRYAGIDLPTAVTYYNEESS